MQHDEVPPAHDAVLSLKDNSINSNRDNEITVSKSEFLQNLTFSTHKIAETHTPIAQSL